MASRRSERAPDIERTHVQAVYSRIAHGFSQTRYRQWPRVAAFLDAQATSGCSFGVDVGCGNGKNMVHAGLFIAGVDLCTELLSASQATPALAGLAVRGTMVSLPLRSASFDFGMCIAALHHLSTHQRRLASICELSRVLRPGGKAMLYVWAAEGGDTDAVQGGRRRMAPISVNSFGTNAITSNAEYGQTSDGPQAKDMAAADVLVPFKSDGDARYYHLFASGELESFVSECTPELIIEASGWDSENWWLVARRAV